MKTLDVSHLKKELVSNLVFKVKTLEYEHVQLGLAGFYNYLTVHNSLASRGQP